MIDEKQNRYVGREHGTVVPAYLREIRPPVDVLNSSSALFFPVRTYLFTCRRHLTASFRHI